MAKVADSICRLKSLGHQLIVVVSAQEGTTDSLLSLAQHANPNASGSLLDLLLAIGEQNSSALLGLMLQKKGVAVEVKSGHRVGVFADNVSNNANVLSVDVNAFKASLEAGQVVIVSGFQALDPNGYLTTLGRGGSDLTAIALAHFLKADECQILKDVSGVFRIDPALIPNDKKINSLSHKDAYLLAAFGAKIVQAKAAEFALKYKVPFEIKRMDGQEKGTYVACLPSSFSQEDFWTLTVKKERVYTFEPSLRFGNLTTLLKAFKNQAIQADCMHLRQLGCWQIAIDLGDFSAIKFCKSLLGKGAQCEELEKFSFLGKKRPCFCDKEGLFYSFRQTPFRTSYWLPQKNKAWALSLIKEKIWC